MVSSLLLLAAAVITSSVVGLLLLPPLSTEDGTAKKDIADDLGHPHFLPVAFAAPQSIPLVLAHIKEDTMQEG